MSRKPVKPRSATPRPDQPAPNATLAQTHKELIGLIVDLNAALTTATTLEQVEAILNEITEVNHRISLIGRLLFKQNTEAMTKAAAKVSGAIGETRKAIKKLDDIKAFAKSIASFLGFVDKLIDLAKVVL
jgi:hypothetical protein